MIKNTGERIIPALMKPTNGMLLEHLARYQFAIHYAKGRMLDLACGSGFGSQMVAKAAKKELKEVIAVDIDGDIIEYAKGFYYHPLIRFLIGNAADPGLPAQLGQFDLITSFETLEHIEEEEQFLANLYQLLKPGGKLVISTPFGSGRGLLTNEPYHIHQLTEEEFKSLFPQYLTTSFYYQRGVLIEPGRSGMHYPIGIAVCTK